MASNRKIVLNDISVSISTLISPVSKNLFSAARSPYSMYHKIWTALG
jgi:hypothetical protein